MSDQIWDGYLHLTELYSTDTICHFALKGMIDPNGQDDRLPQCQPCSIHLGPQRTLDGYYVVPTQMTVDLYADTKGGIVWLHDRPAELTRTDEGGLYFDAEAFLSKHLGPEAEQTLDEAEWRYRKEREGALYSGGMMVISELGIGKGGGGMMSLFLAPDALHIGETRVNKIEGQLKAMLDPELLIELIMIELLHRPHHLNRAEMEDAGERPAKALDQFYWIRLFTERGDFALDRASQQWNLTLCLDPTSDPGAFRRGKWLLSGAETKEALRILLKVAGTRSDEAIRGSLAKLAILGIARRLEE